MFYLHMFHYAVGLLTGREEEEEEEEEKALMQKHTCFRLWI